MPVTWFPCLGHVESTVSNSWQSDRVSRLNRGRSRSSSRRQEVSFPRGAPFKNYRVPSKNTVRGNWPSFRRSCSSFFSSFVRDRIEIPSRFLGRRLTGVENTWITRSLLSPFDFFTFSCLLIVIRYYFESEEREFISWREEIEKLSILLSSSSTLKSRRRLNETKHPSEFLVESLSSSFKRLIASRLVAG